MAGVIYRNRGKGAAPVITSLGAAVNENTLVSIHGYAGDAHQMRYLLPYYLHHKCPVVIVSPTDAPITPAVLAGRPGQLQYRTGGKRCYVGPESLTRQWEHLKILLTFPQQWFLMNDSDSVCLSPKIPEYVYHSPEVLWSNVVSDAMHDHKRAPDYKYPHLAFQPPYFCSRQVIEKLVAIAPSVVPDVHTPFIDWVMMSWAVDAGIPYENFRDGVSCPSVTPETKAAMAAAVDNGAIWLHSIKQFEVVREMGNRRLMFKRRKGLK